MIAAGIKDAALLLPLGGLLVAWLVLVAWTVRKERRAQRAEVATAEAAAARALESAAA
jgi:hypothetical protein